MGQQSDPDSLSTPTEWQRDTPFERAARLLARCEYVLVKGGATAWAYLYRDLKAFAEHYRRIGIMHFAEKLELLAARTHGIVQRHHLQGGPLPTTMHQLRDSLRDVLRELLGLGAPTTSRLT